MEVSDFLLRKGDWELLLECFRREPDEQARFALALALKENAHKDHRDQLIDLVRNPEVGQDRVEFAEALYRFRDDEVDEFLESLRTDPEIGDNIRRLLETGTSIVE